MTKFKQLLSIFLILTILSTTTLFAENFAENELYTPAYTFKLRSTLDGTKEQTVTIGDKIQISEYINPYMSKVIINNNIEEPYYIYNQSILPFNKLDAYKQYVKANNTFEKSKNYTDRDYLKNVYKNLDLLNEYTKDFNLTANNDEDKLLYILNYINDKNIIYNNDKTTPDEYDYNDYQVKTLPQGLTRCHGITMFAAYLFNKANLEHRIIVDSAYDKNKREFKPGPYHTYNEVKINGKWYNIDLTRILLTKGEPFKPYNHITNGFYNTEFGLEEEFPSLTLLPEKEYKDMFYYTSKIYNPKENLEKNEAYIYI